MHVYGELIGRLKSSGQLSGFLSAQKGISGLLTIPSAADVPVYEGPYEFTPTEETQTAATADLMLTDDITIEPIPEEYIIPAGSTNINQNGPHDVTEYAEAIVNVQPALQAKAITIDSAGTETVTPGSGYYGLSEVEVSVPTLEAFVGKEAEFYTANNTRKWRYRGYVVVDPSDDYTEGWLSEGKYNSIWQECNAIPSNTTITPTESSQTIGGANTMLEGAVTVNAIPSQYIVPSGTYTVDSSGTKDVTNYAAVSVPSGVEGSTYANVYYDGQFADIDFAVRLDGGWFETNYYGGIISYHAVPAHTTITPTESQQTIGGPDYMMEAAVTIAGIPSNYVGSGITRRDSTDLSASGATVSVPAGYYANNVSKAVANGTEGTPTATKGAVNNHAITVTPSVTNAAGYISGGTKTGTAVSVSASELVSGTYTVDSGGTKDVTNYASASVASGSATPASSISATGATVSTGTNTLTLSKSSVSNTPQVSAGYISSGTAGNSSVSLTASVTTKGAATITPTGTAQTIAGGTYLTGTQTIEGIVCSNLIASNIVSGVVVKVGTATDDDSVTSVTGTASGGSSSWTKIGSTTELAVNTTSTSAASAGTIALGSGHFTKDKIIYVRIRDKSGKRSGYFYGSDSFFINWRNANSSTSSLSACAQEYYRCNSDGTYTGASGAYGVYGYSLTTDGTLTIRRRYNSTNTLTINSTYLIDVYELTPPQALF